MTTPIKGIPEGASVIIPRLFCRDVAAEIDFCTTTFDAVGRAITAGGKVVFPVQNQFWGDRIGWIMYPSGHVWTIATRIEETTEEERQARLSRILAESKK
ncbi:MAG: hypothetical protein ACXV8X_03720 [Candidatus Angelobacter sp.]